MTGRVLMVEAAGHRPPLPARLFHTRFSTMFSREGDKDRYRSPYAIVNRISL